MKGDFSKLRFSPNKNYTSVLQQQGRVALDADQNEQCAINDYLRTTETVDVVGEVGGPIHDEGFKITVPGNDAIKIGKGRYYVEGILCENDQPLLYSDQPYLIDPNPTDQALLSGLQQGSIRVIQVYLEVWRRFVTALDDPCLREPALGLADTTARLQTVWRVVAKGLTPTQSEPVNGTVALTNGSATVIGIGTSFTTDLKVGQQVVFASDTTRTAYIVSAIAGDNVHTLSTNFAGATTASTTASIVEVMGGCCNSMHTGLVPEHDPGKLSAQTGAGSGDCSCQPTPAAGYLGLENQLYRVEIHQAGNESTATFKWSRENGSVVVAVTGVSGSQVYVDSLGPDANLGFAVFQWVEISDDTSQFGQDPNQPGDLYQIQSINPETLCLTMTQPVASVDPTKNARMRRWDQFGSSAGANGVSLSAGSWLNLENGIQVEFSNGNYASGDHWLIPARTATGQIEWPPCNSDGNPFQPAYRTEIFLAPLACLQWDTQTQAVNVQDCRKPFYPLTELEPCPPTASCCTITVSPQDLTGNATLQSIVDKAASPTMVVQAASPGAAGNNITVQISNLSLNSTPPTFDLTVTETDVYRGLTTGQSTGIEGVIGDEETWLPNMGPLAHILVGSVNTTLYPANNQEVTLTGGKTGTAQGNIVDSGKKTLVFTLVARSAGADGDLTRATITNLDTTQDPPTFDLTLKWSKTLSRVSLTTLFQQIQSNLSYEITAQPPATVSSVFPAAGMTTLTGGADANPTTGSNAVAAQAGIFGNPGKVCLSPGTYYLSAPLTLGSDHSNLTLESCGGPAILAAGAGWGGGGVLPQGLVLLNSADNISLSGLGFSLPSPLKLVVGTTFLPGLSPTLLEGILGSAVSGGDKEVATLLGRLYVSVGLRHVGCCNLRVENCCFDFPNQVGADFPGALLVAGILASGENSGLALVDNHFEGQVNVIATDDSFFQIRVGYLLAHTVTFSKLSRLAGARVAGQADINELRPRIHEEGTLLPAVLQEASFQGNTFQGLEVPMLIFSECGEVALEDNTIRNCYSGPWIIARSSPPDPTQLAGTPDAAVDVLQDPMLEGALAMAQCYPLPANLQSPQTVTIPSSNIVLSNPPFQNPALAFLNALLQLEVGIEQAAAEASALAAQEGNPVSEPDLCCHVVNNKIATYAVPAWADSTGPGLVIWGEDSDQSTEVIVNSNRLEASSTPFVPTALIVQVGNCVMTGNLLFNDYNSTVNGSLYLAPLGPTNGPPVAVTGNLFNGNTNLSSLVTPAAQTVGMGNGTNTVFNSTLAQHPVQTGTVIIFEGFTQVGNDNGGGTITGTAGHGLSGTIDYGSGATSLTFTPAPAAGTAITVSYYYAKWVPLNGP